ncbi:MAG: monofunctional biosynthetic peptidoglycan transglycosylase [Ignavibacteriae bacterium]|nr:MAG: monofunctional biosynthetic peptidoglycan transglycosylase [Ignavibacteriota bacterium]
MEEEIQQQKSRSILGQYPAVAKFVQLLRRNPIKSLLLFFLGLAVLQILLLPYGSIRQLKTKNAGETAFMREHESNAKEKNRPFHKIQYWIPLRAIPKNAIDAVIVSEDGTFWSHGGFDWFEFRESIERNLEEGRAVRGASTITQQLVKNLFLSSSKNPLRKLKEWILTWYMEQQLSKSRILEIYLNVIEWGDGVYGIEAASHYYFDKTASGLTREECARLAAIIPSPRKHRADVDSKYVLRRSQLILERMGARGL